MRVPFRACSLKIAFIDQQIRAELVPKRGIQKEKARRGAIGPFVPPIAVLARAVKLCSEYRSCSDLKLTEINFRGIYFRRLVKLKNNPVL
jgi:hypothetical protein